MRVRRAASVGVPAAMQGGEAVRARVLVQGAVQGVGFRPFVFALAHAHGVRGQVCNASDGVHIEAEGPPKAVEAFVAALSTAPPPHAVIERLETQWVPAEGTEGFVIVESDGSAPMSTRFLADIATCADCLRELRDRADRRYRYPFLNCTHCGPRYSIVQRAPYDRCHTTMAAFSLCDACAAEYGEPGERRFHAQPTACAVCGPTLAWWDAHGAPCNEGEDALAAAVALLRAGGIVALKGLGGFQLLCDARNDTAVARLRARKQRPAKPFAVMFPDMAKLQHACITSPTEEALLQSAQAPIVLLGARAGAGDISAQVAPVGALTGAMLPSTPLHHLLLEAAAIPLVATSGNLSDEPICTDEHEAVRRLGCIADGFLVHDRPIARPVDDSVVRVIDGAPVLMRAARGYAPLALRVEAPGRAVLAVGGHLKNTVAIAHAGHIVMSQHIGDLETAGAATVFESSIRDLCALHGLEPACVVADLHPDYRSTRHAESLGLPVMQVQHHYAHVLSCMAEHGLTGPVLGIAWDGTGYGTDETIWGGEFLEATVHGFARRAHLRSFRLPGGERAVREPWRCALGLLFEAFTKDQGPSGHASPEIPVGLPFSKGKEFGRSAASRTTAASGAMEDSLQGGGASPHILRSGVPRFERGGDGGISPAIPDALCGIEDLPTLDGIPAADLAVLWQLLDTGLHAPITTSAGRLFDGVASMLGLCQVTSFEGEAAMALEAIAAGAPEPYEMPLIEEDGALVLDWRPTVRRIVEDVLEGRAPGGISARFHATLAGAAAQAAQRIGLEAVVLTGGCFQNARLASETRAQLEAAGMMVYRHHRVPPNDGGLAIGQAYFALQQTEE